MLVTMSNPGLPFAVIGNPGPRRRRRGHIRKNPMTVSTRRRGRRRLSSKQLAALRKGWRALGIIPGKKRRARRNPSTKAKRRRAHKGGGTATGARKARRKRARRFMRARRMAARRFRRKLRGFKVTVRRKAGRRKRNRAFSRKYGIRTSRKGTISFRAGRKRKLVATNPRRRRARRSGRAWRNPAISLRGWQAGLTGVVRNASGLLKGKDMVPNALFATAGMVGGIVGGSFVRGTVMGLIGQVAPNLAANRLVQGVLGGLITYTGSYAIGVLAIKNERKRTAFVTGGAIAAVIGLVMPGAVNRLLTGIPVLGPQLARLPGMNGLGTYVSAPGYQGVGTYVEAPGYQGVGSDDAVAGIGYSQDALAGELGAYVSAPSYQGVGMWDQSFLDQR